MKRSLKILLQIGAWLVFPGTMAFSQVDDYASSKSKDKMPVVIPKSNDEIPVIDQKSKDPMPIVNPDTAGKPAPKAIITKKKKRVYKNNYNLPSYQNHFGDNRIGTIVGQSDTRRSRKKKQAEPL
jgi:hypothetical protein